MKLTTQFQKVIVCEALHDAVRERNVPCAAAMELYRAMVHAHDDETIPAADRDVVAEALISFSENELYISGERHAASDIARMLKDEADTGADLQTYATLHAAIPQALPDLPMRFTLSALDALLQVHPEHTSEWMRMYPNALRRLGFTPIFSEDEEGGTEILH